MNPNGNVNGPLIRDRRDEFDWSNAELAERVKLQERSLVNILSGSDRASNRVIHRLARVLDLPVEKIRLATYPDEPPKQPPRPKSPPRRQDREQTKAPKRVQENAA